MAPAFLLRAPAGATRKIVRGFAPPLKGRPQRFTLGGVYSARAEEENFGGSTIALNRRAKFDYHLEERFEAGIALEGWEVKSSERGGANWSSRMFSSKRRGLASRRPHQPEHEHLHP